MGRKTTQGMGLRATMAAGFLAASTLAGINAAQAAEPYTIDVVLPLTGGASFLGNAERKALELQEKIDSSDGGIGGRPVHFNFYDDQSSPQTAVQLATSIVAKKPAVMLGSTIVAMCNAMAPLMVKGPVMYCHSPGLYPKPGSFVFSASGATKDLAATTLRYYQQSGKTKIALITSTDASGTDAGKQIKAQLALPEFKDMQLVAEASFNPTDVSAAAQVQRLKSAEPQAMIAWSTGAAIGTVFKAIVDAGLDIPVATTDGNMTLAQMHQFAAVLPKTLLIATPEWPESNAPEPTGVKAAKAAFFAAYKEAGITPDGAAPFSWDPGLLVVSALKKLGPDATAEQVRDYLSKLKDFSGINGVYDFTKVEQRGLDDSSIVMTRWDKGQDKWVVVSKTRGLPLDK